MKTYIKPDIHKVDDAIANMLSAEFDEWCRDMIEDVDYWVDMEASGNI